MNSVRKPRKALSPRRYGLTHCLECDRKIPASSRYTYFCSKDCAADWGDDEAQMQYLRHRARERKKEKAQS